MEKRTKTKSPIRTAYIGIDPGANGGIAMITVEHNWYAERFPIDKDPAKAKQLYKYMQMQSRNEGFETITYIENVHAMPNDGRSSAFEFGVNYGIWLGITSGHEVHKISPQKWQRHYGELPKEKKEKKNKLKEIAINLVGEQCKTTLATSDAILIANYGKENLIEE